MSDLVNDLVSNVFPCIYGAAVGGLIGFGLGGPIGAAAGAALGCSGLYAATAGTGQPILPGISIKQNNQEVARAQQTSNNEIGNIMEAMIMMQMLPVMMNIQSMFKPPSLMEKLMQQMLNFVPLVLLALVL